MLIRTNKGLDLPLSGSPAQRVDEAPPVSRVALLGADYAGLRPKMLVHEGEAVRFGQPMFEDRGNPGVPFTSPGAGIVEAVHRGPRRALVSVVIRLDEATGDPGPGPAGPDPRRLREALDAATVRADLIASGWWTALRQRPYGRIPTPQAVPRSLFVTAMDSNPLAADPAVVVAGHAEEFLTGLRVLSTLTPGPVFVCRAPGAAIPVPDAAPFVCAEFAGPHPSGLVGTHIHLLDPVDARRHVWHVGYQDVLAVGQRYTHGATAAQRVVALTGPMAREPRLLRTRLGADIEDLVRGQVVPGPCRIVSGPALSGRRTLGASAFLGRHHTQVTLLPEGGKREFLGWMSPGFGKFSATRAFASALTRRPLALDTSQNGSPRAMVPIGSYERVMPLDLLATPLLRALLVRDTETAERLGCLELEEEDLALCTFVCPGKYDYGSALRETLNLLERDG